jgi:ArsR family transcriptional regulator, arsenate/arsenite/antimonite-responsive transcriptional repressor / arsenate reductase (thioredoxin)
MDSKEAATAFAALAQETRVKLVCLLSTAGGLAAGELSAKLAVPASTLSFHLAALEQAGLVQSSRRRRQMIYTVRATGLRKLLTFVTETCCPDRPDIAAELARLFPDSEEAQAMEAAFNVLFLCNQNSARSIMAEAILDRIGHGHFHAYSAGASPAKSPLPEVITKLRTLGHDVSNLRSKSWNEFAGPDAPRMDFIIALCDTPRGQKCPEFGEKALSAAWPLPDPAQFTGNDVERAVLLNELYGAIRRRVEVFCSLSFATLDRMAIKARLDEIGGRPMLVHAR